MKLNGKYSVLLALLLVVFLVTSCGSDSTKTDEAPASAPNSDVDTVEALSMDEAAELGQWVASMKNGKNSNLGHIRYRINRISDDQEAILALIEEYNADDNLVKVGTDLPDGMSFRLGEYELVYEPGFPAHGEDGNSVMNPKLDFSVKAQEGGLDTASGYSLIGLSSTDISKKVEDLRVGDTFNGLVLYAIPDDAIEQYYLTYFYSDKDKDGNAKSVFSYVIPEVIEAK